MCKEKTYEIYMNKSNIIGGIFDETRKTVVVKTIFIYI
jgi:hypothetical protein